MVARGEEKSCGAVCSEEEIGHQKVAASLLAMKLCKKKIVLSDSKKLIRCGGALCLSLFVEN